MLKTIDWNQLSELGLQERITRQVLLPLGLGITRLTGNGTSPGCVVADGGGAFHFTGESKDVLTDDQIKARIQQMIQKDQVAYD